MRVAILLLSFVALVFSAYVPYTYTEVNTIPISNTEIYYSPNFFALPNIENPLTIDITFSTTDDVQANVCLSSTQQQYPVPGNNVEHACPNGGFVLLNNGNTTASAQPAKLKFTRMNSSLRGQFLSKMVEDTSANAQSVSAIPTTGAGFTITTTSTTPVTFSVSLTGFYCDNGDFPLNGTCVPALPAKTDGTGNPVTVESNSWTYYTFTTPVFASNVVNEISIVTNATTFYVQKDYIPTATFNLGASASPVNIFTPGTFAAGETYFIGFENTGAAELSYSLNVTFVGCTTGLVGPSCAVNSTSSNSTTDGTMVREIVASLDSNNDGSAISFDLSDSENTFAYFQLVDLPVFASEPNDGFPYYVRVSVANTNLEDDEDNFGPNLYAKLDGFPSVQSNDYAVGGSVANQVILPVNSADDNWYLAVALPSEFSIWVGANCAGNCSNNDHGSCLCSAANGTTVQCSTIANSTNYYALYTLPTSTGESAGACTCTDSDYEYSFDCSQKSSPTVLFIVLIVIGGLIILFVAIGVPLYCYISNKRKERYERI